MPSKIIRIIFIGDIVGRFGRHFLKNALPILKKKYRPELMVANGENLAGGLGITSKTSEEMFNAGIHVITSGNHVWDKKEALELLDNETMIIRPLNFPRSNPGRGYCEFKIDDSCTVTIVNIQGRVFMEPVVDNPFLAIKDLLKSIKNRVILVDFHAEASAEKQAMGFFLDGKVSAVLGTHTHVPSADLRILPGGTAYQTDVGMTGSLDSVIGMKKKPIVSKFLTGINQRFEVAKRDMIMDLVVLDIDRSSGRTNSVERVRLHESDLEGQLFP
jgi:metallophosphoesterase (TIGR00282 family)